VSSLSTYGNCAIRGAILSFHDDPALAGEQAYRYLQDGIILIEDGKIKALGPSGAIVPDPGCTFYDYSGHLIMPGFIDSHCHYPQIEMIASHGAQLIEWLTRYIFPTERQFDDAEHARRISEFFLAELLRQGTTTASVFATVHPGSADIFFETAHQLNMRMICGKVMMDRLAPEWLQDSAEQSYLDSRTLLQKWHGTGRQLYAITPRFALSSSPLQLQLAGELYAEFPGCYMQTHLAENREELAQVSQQFADCRDYLDVYERANLLGERSLFAHCIHLNQREFSRLQESRSKAVFCPSSNLFLGSGLFDLPRFHSHNAAYALASDVGAGTSLSMLKTLADAYKVGQLQGLSLNPLNCFYQLTLGNARALMLDDFIGSLAKGKEADLVVLDLQATPLLSLRQSRAESLEESLFALMMLGDERVIKATFIAGKLAYRNEQQAHQSRDDAGETTE
jgi:guanine deaminase